MEEFSDLDEDDAGTNFENFKNINFSNDSVEDINYEGGKFTYKMSNKFDREKENFLLNNSQLEGKYSNNIFDNLRREIDSPKKSLCGSRSFSNKNYNYSDKSPAPYNNYNINLNLKKYSEDNENIIKNEVNQIKNNNIQITNNTESLSYLNNDGKIIDLKEIKLNKYKEMTKNYIRIYNKKEYDSNYQDKIEIKKDNNENRNNIKDPQNINPSNNAFSSTYIF